MSEWTHLGASCSPGANGAWTYRPPARWTAARVRWLTQRWGWLSELSGLVPTILAEADGAWLLRAGSGGAPFAPSPAALADLAPLLGQLDRALRARDLHLALAPADLWVDADGRPWLFGLAGLRRALGAPGLANAAGTLLELGGAESLDAWRDAVWPHELAAWRAASSAGSLVELGRDLADHGAARRGTATRCFPASAGAGWVLGPAPAEPDHTARWALDPAHDRLRVLVQPRHPLRSLEAVRARRAAFLAQHPGATPGPTLDPWLAQAPAPELRHAEPSALSPPPLLPWVAARPAPAPPRLRVTKAEAGAELSLEALPAGTSAVVFVRCGAEDPWVPDDGAEPVEVSVEALPYVDPTPAERYAAFARVDGRLAPPGLASYWGGPEVLDFACEPGIGCVHLRWDAEPEALIEVYADGRLAHSEQGSGTWVHDCLDPDQRVRYRVCVSLSDGSRSPGAEGAAVALGPPPALTGLEAQGGNLQAALRWTWPASSSYDRLEVTRDPAFPEGPRVLRRGAEPELVDLEVDPGVCYRYTARLVHGETRAMQSAEAQATPWAELEAVAAEPGGEAVCLSWELPPGLDPAAAEVVAVRNLERPPADLADGAPLSGLARGSHVDAPLPVGAPVHYRLALRLGGVTSEGRLVEAAPREPAGALGPVELEAQQGSLSLRVTPPTERCEALQVYVRAPQEAWRLLETAPAGEPLTLELPARPGVPTRVRVVPVHAGSPDPAQAVEREATAWDDLTALTAPPRGDCVELRWSPPAAPPAGYRVVRVAAGGRAGEERTWSLGPDATSLVDEDVTPRQSYRYAVSCEWAAGGEVRAHEVEVTALASPPDLPQVELRSEPGAVLVRYLPVPASARLHASGAAVFRSSRPAPEFEALLDRGATFDLHAAEDLGLTELALRPRSKRKELVRCPAPPSGELATYVVASLNGSLARPVLIRPILGLSDDFAELRSTSRGGAPHLSWSWPPFLEGPVHVTRLVLERGLQDVPPSLAGDELEALSAPFSAELPPTATSFVDDEAPSFLSWGYRLVVTLSVHGEAFEVAGPRLVLPPTLGGTLSISAQQPRGLFGSKQRVEISLSCPAPRWPAFDIVRAVGNQQAGKVVCSFSGGEPQGRFVDDDLANFSAGTRLRYRVELKRSTDRLGFEVSEAEVQLG
ncbi:MAG: fibronectin type III domain-containing protein [Planctomycetota bacterium]